MAKSTCSISRSEFRGNAGPINVAINGSNYVVAPKEFDTGSLGWYLNGKGQFKAGEAINVSVDGVPHVANYRQFSTGSYGWNVSAKQVVKVGGKAVATQVGMNITIVGSKAPGFTPPAVGSVVNCQIGAPLTLVGSKELPQS